MHEKFAKYFANIAKDLARKPAVYCTKLHSFLTLWGISMSATELLDNYKAGGLGYLQSLVGKSVETHFQDFKLMSTDSAPMQKSDKQNYSEALSGFSNSNGGLIVWGVDCRKDGQGRDVVQRLQAIKNLTGLLSDLNDLQAQSVTPGSAAEHFPISDGIEEDTGFIVSYIPPGEIGSAYMASHGQRFMYRSGGSFLPMTQPMVAVKFGKRAPDLLILSWEPSARLSNDGVVHTIWLKLFMENQGNNTAKYPSFELKTTSSFDATKILNDDVLRSITTTKTTLHYEGRSNSDIVINRKSRIEIGVLPVSVQLDAPDVIEIAYVLKSEDGEASDTLIISIDDVRRS